MKDYTEVKRLYDMGLTDSEISRRLNISRLSIRNWRKQEGLETRYATSQKVNTGNICFDCRRPSVLCPWLLEEAPVPGWTAIPTKINNFHASGSQVDSFKVTACPLYIEPKKRGKAK